jgi:hypothetical protein
MSLEIGREDNNEESEMRIAATHHQHIWAILKCIRGSRLLVDREGCKAITERARRDLGPHSLEWGK